MSSPSQSRWEDKTAMQENKLNHDWTGSDIENIVREVIATIQQKKSSELKYDFCDKSGHIMEQCFLNPDNPNNRLTTKMKEAMSIITTVRTSSGSKSKSKVEIVGSTVESTSVQPASDQRTYADSAATSHCFHSRNSFVYEWLRWCRQRTFLLD